MASTLSQADVAKLLAEPSPHVRSELAGKLAQELDSPRLTEHELTLAQDIVRVMAKDVEVTVRQALAQSLRKAARLPHDVAVKLANDIESVALPILEHSEVLTDDDLADIIKSGADIKHEAIAARPKVSEKVAAALIDTSGEKAVAALMSNAGARISDSSLNKAVDRFAASDMVKEKMVQRAALPAAVAERLVTIVSENLKDYLVSHHELSPAMAAIAIIRIVGISGKKPCEARAPALSSNVSPGKKKPIIKPDSPKMTPAIISRATKDPAPSRSDCMSNIYL